MKSNELILAVTLGIIFFLSGTEALAAKILVVRQSAQDFVAAEEGFKAAIGSAHTISDFVIDNDTTYEIFKAKVTAEKPDLLLLMDNKPVTFAQKFNEEPDPYAKNLRSVATMGLNLKKVLNGSKNICGVAYEVPAFTIITQFRYAIKSPIKNILVIYRKSEFDMTLSEATTQLQREGINLIALDAEAEGAEPEKITDFIDKNLKDEAQDKKIDAVWVLSDNKLLNKNTFGQFWVARARDMKVPFLCGIEKFAAKEMDFCTYSASPEHKDLGQQVAEMVFSILDEGRKPAEIKVDYIISVKKTLNSDRLSKVGLDMDPEHLANINISK